MATVTLDDGSLYDIADAIRSKLGVSTTYLPSEMAAAIMSIENQEIIQGYYIANNFFEDSAYTIPIFGEFGKIYVDLSNGGLYRYNGNGYTELSEGLRLGETDSTAYRGDRGKIAYDHAQARGNEYSSGLYKIGTNAEGHVTTAVQVSKSDITSLGIPAHDTTYEETSEEEDGLFTWEEKLKLMNIEARATYDMPHDHDPLMDGTASAGTYNSYARGDHRHPTDTTRMAADLKGAANGVAELDAGGKVPSSQLPSYVDDVLEYSSQSALPATGETGKIYVTTDTNTTYRWSGSAYVPISNPLDYATQAEAETGAENTHVMTPLRTKQAIDANAYELPLMSESTRGGAKLGHGLTVEDGALGIGEVTDPTDAGPIVELTAKGWAEQDTTVDPPSPSPSYPQEIKVCRGRNLLRNTATSQTINGVTFTVNEDGSITMNGTASANATYDVFPVSPNGYLDYSGTVTISMGAVVLPSGAYYAYSDGAPSDTATNHGFQDSETFTLSESNVLKRIYILIPSGVTCNNITCYPQLEAGSVVHPYVPYGCIGVDVQSRNLLPNMATSQTINGVTFTVNSDGTIHVVGTASARAICYLFRYRNIALESGSYVITLGTTGIGCGCHTSNEGWKSVVNSPVSLSGTLIDFWIDVAANKTVDTTVYPMLVKGDTTLPYEPYINYAIPVPLPSRGWVAALPDGTADALTLDGAGGYVWEINTNEIVVNGGMNSFNSGDGFASVNGLFFTGDIVGVNSKGNRSNILLSHFRAGNTGDGSNPNRGYVTAGGQRLVLVDDGTNFTDLATTNAWLAENPVTVLYPLANPTTEQGYVDSMPTVPIHAAISSVDLVDLAVRCCADEGAAEIASAWGKRYESRIANLESAVAELIAGA